MLYAIFPDFVNMSLTAAAVILIVALLRPLLRRAPRSIIFVLWGAVLFRLVCPVSFSAEYALLPAAETVDHRIQYLPAELIEDGMRFSQAGSFTAVAETAADGFTLLDFSRMAVVLGTWVWCIGILVFLAVNAVSLLRLRSRCIGSVETEKRVYLSDHIETPFVLGIFKPRIYLPSTLSAEETVHVLYHERTHIRRGDPLWKLIAFLALALHWFNPAVWLAFHLFVQDMETACDEHVLRTMDANARADYAETLLHMSANRRILFVSPAFGEDSPKKRIRSILRYKRPFAAVTVIAVFLAVILSVLLVANPLTKTAALVTAVEEFPDYKTVPGVFVLKSTSEGAALEEAFTDPADAAAVYSILRNLTVEVNPAAESRSEEREQAYTFGLGTDHTSSYTHFSSNFDRLWVDNGVKPSYTYTVCDTDTVRDLYLCLRTGTSQNCLLDAVFRANRAVRETGGITVLYCPKATDTEGFIKIGILPDAHVSNHLSAALNTWQPMNAPRNSLPSPESIEYVIEDDNLRIQIWKSPSVAVIRHDGTESWYRVPKNDYDTAVNALLAYSRTPEEPQPENEEAEPSSTPEASPTMSPTPEPTPTPYPEEANATPQPTKRPQSSMIPGTNTPTSPPPAN